MPPSVGPGKPSARCLDTNVLVSALLFTGTASELVPLWQQGAITVLLSRGILEEYLRVLSYPKFQLSEGDIKSLIEEEVLPYVEVVSPKRRLGVVKRDPSDDKFLECAMGGKAEVIISGDKDLLFLGRYRRIRIQSPAQFLEAKRGRPDS
jgi:putative PIN family toxin of toxin-antitoxin system